MCRNIRTLFNFQPPATDEEIRAASLQFVRKLSGFNKPSLANAAAFAQAVEDVAAVARTLIDLKQAVYYHLLTLLHLAAKFWQRAVIHCMGTLMPVGTRKTPRL